MVRKDIRAFVVTQANHCLSCGCPSVNYVCSRCDEIFRSRTKNSNKRVKEDRGEYMIDMLSVKNGEEYPCGHCQKPVTRPYVWTCHHASRFGICEGLSKTHLHISCPCGYEEVKYMTKEMMAWA